MSWQQLQGHVPVEPRASGSIHLSHTAFTDLGDDEIRAEAGAWLQGHGWGTLHACHEGNHGMRHVLRAARTDEQQALEAAARVSRQRKVAGHPGVREPAGPFMPTP